MTDPLAAEGQQQNKRAIFFSTMKMMVRLWPHWYWWQNFKATDCPVVSGIVGSFFPLERNRRNPAWSPNGEGHWTFQTKWARDRAIEPLAEPLRTSYSGFANVMHQDSYEVCSRPWRQNGQLESWSLGGIHGNTTLLLILQSLLLALFIAVRESNMKSHYGWIVFLLTCGVNQVS